jgi:hypothetical protein
MMEQLGADRLFLGDASDYASLTEQKSATADERATAADAHDFLMAIRNAVARRTEATEALKTAIGIGDGLRAGDTPKVLSALGAVATNAAALQACGVLPEDIAEAAALAEQLRGDDVSQQGKLDHRQSTTEDRHQAQVRLEEAVDAISSAGVLAFRKDPVIRASFERLVAAGGPSREDDPGSSADPAVRT